MISKVQYYSSYNKLTSARDGATRKWDYICIIKTVHNYMKK